MISLLAIDGRLKTPQSHSQTLLPSIRSLFGDSPEMVHLSLSGDTPNSFIRSFPDEPITPLISSLKEPPSGSNRSAYSFFEECEEEFRRGLRRGSSDRQSSSPSQP